MICEIKGLKATGRPVPTGFLVLKGSQAVFKERASAHQYPYTLVTRNKLIEDRALIQRGEHYVFTRDVEFSSPSAAATVVHGGSANGLLAWKTRSVLAAAGHVTGVEDTEFGRKYTVPGALTGPVRAVQVLTVWIEEPGQVTLRLVTVQPR